jgi:hypothetical protein
MALRHQTSTAVSAQAHTFNEMMPASENGAFQWVSRREAFFKTLVARVPP